MPMCDKELTATLESPAQPIGRVTVNVRCEGASPSTVFVQSQHTLFPDVGVVARPPNRTGISRRDADALR